MVVVAWVSRHPPLEKQVKELERIFGDVDIVQIEGTFKSAEEILEKIKDVGGQVAVVVLPLQLLINLLQLSKNEGIEIWTARMEPIHECAGPDVCTEFDPTSDVWLPSRDSELGRHLRFTHFERLISIDIIKEPVY